jgi:hypothetical protein
LVSSDEDHALLSAFRIAFYDHMPLGLSPDAIWIRLVRGFALHVNEHAEQLRRRFVSHSGKEKLVVERPDFLPGKDNPWPEAFETFSDQLDERTGGLTSLVRVDFSTTSPVERAVSHLMAMETFRSYFEYEMRCGCGIPTITLTGTVADWRRLREKAQRFAVYGLQGWIEALDPVLAQFSPDGRRVAFIAVEPPPGLDVPIGRDRDFNLFRHVSVFKLNGEAEGHSLLINGQNLAWTPDGKLVVVEAGSMKDVRARKFTTWLVDVGTKEKTKLDVPETAQVFCVTPDGTSYIATTYDFDKKQFHLVSISRHGNTVFLQSDDRRNLLLCARQVGKSLTVAALALHAALTRPQTTTVVIAPIEPQASELLRKVTRLFNAVTRL